MKKGTPILDFRDRAPRVLAYLRANGGKAPAANIRRDVGRWAPATIDRLVEAGVVRRVPHPFFDFATRVELVESD